MADVTFTVAGGAVKKLKDMGDGTWAEVVSLAADPTINIGEITEIPIGAAAAISPSDTVPVTAGRQLAIICTVAGNVKVKFSDGSTLVFPVAVGFTVMPWAVIQIYVTLTTATATYANLS